jgi:hypothetical protein
MSPAASSTTDGDGAVEAHGAREREVLRAPARQRRERALALAGVDDLGGRVEHDHELRPRIGVHQHPAVDAPADRAVRGGHVGRVVVREEVAVEHDDPPARHVGLRDQLAVPLLGEPVGQAEARTTGAACATPGRRSARLQAPPSHALDGVGDARGGKLAVAGVGADAHVEVADTKAGRALEGARHRRLAGAVAADQGHGEAATRPAPRGRHGGHCCTSRAGRGTTAQWRLP